MLTCIGPPYAPGSTRPAGAPPSGTRSIISSNSALRSFSVHAGELLGVGTSIGRMHAQRRIHHERRHVQGVRAPGRSPRARSGKTGHRRIAASRSIPARPPPAPRRCGAVVGGIFCAAKAAWISRAQPARSLTVEGILRTMSARVCSAVGPRCLWQPVSATASSRQAMAGAKPRPRMERSAHAQQAGHLRFHLRACAPYDPARRRAAGRTIRSRVQVSRGPRGDSRGRPRASPSPDPHAVLRRAPHRLARLHAERLVELRDVRHRPEHAPLRRRMHVASASARRRRSSRCWIIQPSA